MVVQSILCEERLDGTSCPADLCMSCNQQLCACLYCSAVVAAAVSAAGVACA